MLTLIGSSRSRAFRVLWLLEELQVPYELIEIFPHEPKALELNPSGKIPILQTEGQIITDSLAICNFLADRHKKFTFKPGTTERARQDSVSLLAANDMEAPLWLHRKHTFNLPQKQRVPQILLACKKDFSQELKTFETRLGDNAYVMGDTFTIADIITMFVLAWAKLIEFEMGSGKARHYMENLKQRPAYQRAVQIRRQSRPFSEMKR